MSSHLNDYLFNYYLIVVSKNIKSNQLLFHKIPAIWLAPHYNPCPLIGYSRRVCLILTLPCMRSWGRASSCWTWPALSVGGETPAASSLTILPSHRPRTCAGIAETRREHVYKMCLFNHEVWLSYDQFFIGCVWFLETVEKTDILLS